VNPTSFDNNFSAYVTKIPSAQSSLDTSGTVSGGGWLQNLNTFPAAGSGTPPVLINTATLLGISATSPSSYSKILNASGLNEIDGTMPFSTAATLSTDPEVVDLWMANRTALTTSSTTLLGTLTVDGNVAGTSGGEVAITFTAVPEPGTLVLVAAGLSGLVWAGRGRRTE